MGGRGVGANLLFVQIFFRKRHDNERNWTEGMGGRASLSTLLDPPLLPIKIDSAKYVGKNY